MANDKVYTKAELQDLQNGILHYYSPELGLSGAVYTDDGWVGPGRFFSAKNRGGFFKLLAEATYIKGATPEEIRKAYEDLEEKIKTAPDATEFEGPKESPVSGTTVGKEKLEELQEAQTKQQEKLGQRKLSDEEVRKAIAQQKLLYEQEIAKVKALQEKLKTTQAKVYVKVEKPQAPEDKAIAGLKEQAVSNPEKFVNETSEQLISSPAIVNLPPEQKVFVAKQAALTTHQVLTGNSPLIQAAVLQKVSADPLTPPEVKDIADILIEQKISQYELAKQLYPSLDKIDGISKIEDVQVFMSPTQQEGYEEFDFDNQVVNPHLDSLNNQNNFLSEIKDVGVDEIKPQLLLHVGRVLDTQIAKLPSEAFVSRAWNADIVRVGLARIGLIEAPSIVAAEGSFLGKTIIATGFGDVANFIQAKTGINLGVKIATQVGAKALTGAATGAGIGAAGGAVAGAAGGEAMGASIGAAVGSLIPGVGTIIVGILGAIGGWIATKIPWKKVLPVGLGLLAGGALLNVFGPMAAVLGGMATYVLVKGAVPAAIGAGILGAFSINIIGTTFRFIMPMVIGFISLVLFAVFTLFIINSGAFVVPPGLGIFGNIASPYIDIIKTSNPEGPLENSSLPVTATYTVTIKAKKGPLTNIKIDDKCQVVSRTVSDCPDITLPPPPDSISPSLPFTFTYTVSYGSQFADSAIINDIIVTADVVEQAGVIAVGGTSLTIGNPPITCPVVGGHVASPLLNYSYDSVSDTGHGSTKYWNAVGGSYSYHLPQQSSCLFPGDCSYYGYAYDIFPSSSTAVFAPTVLGKETSWTCSYAFSNGGGAAGFTYRCNSSSGNDVLVLTHVNKDIKTGTVSSGEQLGTLFNQRSNTHLHLEFQHEGRFVKPEKYFCDGK